MIDLLLILVVLTNLKLLGASRLGASIRTVAAQGVVLGLLPLVTHPHPLSIRILELAAGSVIIKGFLIPGLLFRAVREVDVSREIEPLVGYITSLLFGLAALGLSVWFGAKLPLPMGALSSWLVPVSFFCIISGFFLIVARKRAVTQVLGFLVLENGIYTFGVGAMQEVSPLVEAGVLLDVLVAVFIMGIIIFHISREFEHIETDRLSTLKD
jgi:hydrogenase-4 component E